MMLIVSVAASVGFLASFALLRAGVDVLWLRYLIAVGLAYLGFLCLLWCWLRLRRDDALDNLELLSSGARDAGSASIQPSWQPGGGRFGGGGASGSFDDEASVARVVSRDLAPSGGGSGAADAGGFDLEELAFVLIVIAALVGALFAAFWIIWAAPALLAELVLDAALAAGLYRRVHAIEARHWLRTAVRRTVVPFVAVALLFALTGLAMQLAVPEARSVGQVLDHYTAPR
jgi:hypothetical protein